MIRENLEMIPVAVIMAFTLYFGTAAGQKSRAEHLPPDSGRGANASTDVSGSLRNLPGHSSTEIVTIYGVPLESETFSATTASKTTGAQLHRDDTRAYHTTVKSREFLSRKSVSGNVPYFSSQDIPSRSSSRNDELVMPRQSADRDHERDGYSAASGTTGASLRTGLSEDLAERSKPHHSSLNTADLNTLLKIPGIGRSRAEILIAARPAAGYADWNEIDRLPGFGTSTIQMMKLYVNLE